MGLESIINEIESIAPLPKTVLEIEKLFMQGDADINKLVKLVEKDSVLTADILSLVNSPLYSFSKTIVSIRQAVTLFGINTIRGFMFSSISKKAFKFDVSPYALSNEEFQNVSSLQSMLMFQWYMSVDVSATITLVPISFLMQTGKIIIANEISNSDYEAEFTRMIQEKNSITETEKLFTGFSSAEVTSLLFKHWNFNDIFSNVIKGSDNPNEADKEYRQLCRAIDVVQTAINIQDIFTETSIENAKTKALLYGFDIEKLTRTLHRIQVKLE